MNAIYDNNCLINIDEQKYSFNYDNNIKNYTYIEVADKLNDKVIIKGIDLRNLLQISDNEFLVLWENWNNKYKFQHIHYDREKQEVNIKFDKYILSSNEICEMNINNEIVVINNNNHTIIYNYKNSKSLELENFEVVNFEKTEQKLYINGKININDHECLLVNIDTEKLEFDLFYSMMQNRYINITKNDNLDFKTRFSITLQQEVFKYVEYIEELEEYSNINKMNKVYKKLSKVK